MCIRDREYHHPTHHRQYMASGKCAKQTRQSRRIRKLNKRHGAPSIQRVLQHLHEVDEFNRRSGRTKCCSLRLRIKRSSIYSLHRSCCRIVLFGEDGYFSDNNKKEGGPLEGYCFYYDGDSSDNNCDNHYPDDDEDE